MPILYEIRARYSMSEKRIFRIVALPYPAQDSIGETLIEYVEYSSAEWDGVSGGWRGVAG